MDHLPSNVAVAAERMALIVSTECDIDAGRMSVESVIGVGIDRGFGAVLVHT
jgi:hypothetical protein